VVEAFSVRLSTRYRTLLAVDVAGCLTTLVMLLPFVYFAYQSTALHATIETACGMIALLAGFLFFGRFRRTSSSDDLALTVALGFIACASLLFSATPWALFSDATLRFSAWTSLLGTVTGAGVLAYASLMPRMRLGRPRVTARRVLWTSLLAFALLALAVGFLQSRLSLGFGPTTSPQKGVQLVGAGSLIGMQFLGALFFMVAAVGFTRRAERTGDELMTWLAASAALASFARLNYGFFPSLYTQWVYVGDALRVASYLLMLGGAAREIARYQQSLAEAAVAEERRRIARDLHDGLAQELAYLATHGPLLGRRSDLPELEYVAAAAERALAESRRAIALLSSSSDEPLDLALVQTVEELVNRAGGRAEFDVETGVDVPPATREALLRIVREAVTNASRHGRAETVKVELHANGGVRLRVRDDGVGFEPASAEDASAGFGLATMRSRAEAIGGRLRIDSAPGVGTEVEVLL
jgi:signal transduction histidine kinase